VEPGVSLPITTGFHHSTPLRDPCRISSENTHSLAKSGGLALMAGVDVSPLEFSKMSSSSTVLLVGMKRRSQVEEIEPAELKEIGQMFHRISIAPRSSKRQRVQRHRMRRFEHKGRNENQDLVTTGAKRPFSFQPMMAGTRKRRLDQMIKDVRIATFEILHPSIRDVFVHEICKFLSTEDRRRVSITSRTLRSLLDTSPRRLRHLGSPDEKMDVAGSREEHKPRGSAEVATAEDENVIEDEKVEPVISSDRPLLDARTNIEIEAGLFAFSPFLLEPSRATFTGVTFMDEGD